ncbi:transient receptor potential channel pyrexia-like [Toxorhynchites rutilus septentrionalis]|uniref:transient receptor potential channel pyrexia-like n=1 Tax=Toxorhynchites rutilus septentrionalis TaxID=329112 RepID=UPI0024797F19|nr:transient receptor potential channel pyrexia-like [Toxorhynchites rutilus septentrionalis]
MKNPDPAEKPATFKQSRIVRGTSVFGNGIVPLTLTARSKTLSAEARWQNDPEMMTGGAFPGVDFEYMKVGPSPPAESAPNLYDSYEEPSPDVTSLLCGETIRTSLLEQIRNASGRTTLLEDVENCATNGGNVREVYQGSSKIEKNISFLWAAYLNRLEILEGLIDSGAEVMFYDCNGLTALHLSSFSNSVSCTNYLIEKGVEVNVQPKWFSPLHCAALGNSIETTKILINNGSNLNIYTNKPDCQESLLHCAVRSNSLGCVQLLIAEGLSVNMLDQNGSSPIHLAADLGHTQCLQALLESPEADPNMKVQFKDKETTALHLAADEGNLECITLLLSKGADSKAKNHRGFTPLHLAARAASVESVEALLRIGNADPNTADADHRTPLHAAVGKSDLALDILDILISWGANVNHKDVYGFTALHLAALDGLAHCVEILLFHGADVTTKSKKGTTALNVITRKTPSSLAVINHKLDAAIALTHSHDSSNREVELELDFRSILQHCHPREISYLNTFVDEGQKEILQHPLCSAFLYIKWGKIRKYYIARLLFCFTFVLFLTLYVLTALAHNCYNGSKDMKETIQEQELCQKQSILGDMLRNNPFVMEMQWMVLVAITIVEICRKIYGITGYTSFRHYVTQAENAIEWFIIVSVFVISYIYTKRTYTWQNHIGAFAVLLGWTNLMLMIGQLPVFGAYVAMYRKVQVEFAKLFMAYSCMLIGFTISFCVIFPSSSSFANPFMGFITVLVMMTGEQDLELLINDPDGKDPPFLLEISAQITFVLFLLFVTVILMNLLIGIAVHDIQGLKKTAGLSKLVRQTKLISYIESALFNGWLPNWLRSLLHYTALVSPQAYRVVLSVKPLNPGEKRLPRDIMMAAYEVAKQRKHFGHTALNRNTAVSFINLKTKFEANDRSADSDCGFETASICTLTNKIDENAEKIELLKNEIRDLRTSLQKNQHVLEQLLCILTDKQQHQSRKCLAEN